MHGGCKVAPEQRTRCRGYGERGGAQGTLPEASDLPEPSDAFHRACCLLAQRHLPEVHAWHTSPPQHVGTHVVHMQRIQ